MFLGIRTSLAGVVLALTVAASVQAQQAAPATGTPQEPSSQACTDLSRKTVMPCPNEDGSVPGTAAAPVNDSSAKASDESSKAEAANNAAERPADVKASPAAASAKVTKADAALKTVNVGNTAVATVPLPDGEPTQASGGPAGTSDSAVQPEAVEGTAAHGAWWRTNPLEFTYSPASVRNLPRNFAIDQRNFWTSPLRISAHDLFFLVPLGGLSAGLVSEDTSIEKHLPTSTTWIQRSKSFGTYGAAAFAGAVGGAYVLGKMTQNDQLTETGLLSGEAAVNTVALSYLVKAAAGRQRPYEGNGQGDFRVGGSSFPSEHSAAAWAIASVVAHEYPGPLTQLLAYGAASGLTASRVIGRQHFASDVLVGSALGWFVGRQVFRAHSQITDVAQYGTFERAPREAGGRISATGSPYVPLDSWVYSAFDRLAALGYVQTAFAGVRPWTRLECARLLDEAALSGANADAGDREAGRIYNALAAEFGSEAQEGPLRARVDSVYARFTGITGSTLNDSYHFGQTIVNDYGRPYAQGANAVLGVSADTETGPFAFYVRGEFQHAPSAPALPLAARQVISGIDVLPLSPPLPQATVDRFTPVEAYATLNLRNLQISAGRQALWWGPDQTGPMLFSTNSQPIDMVRINEQSPVRLPGPLKYLGPVRTEFFVGRLTGFHFMYSQADGLLGDYSTALPNQPYIHGEKLSFKPTPNFEIGFSRTTLFGGSVFPFTFHTFFRSLFATSNQAQGAPDKAGDRRAGLDFSYRIPKLRNWLTFYADGFTDDEYSPIAYWDRSAWTSGMYLSHFPKINALDLRVEGVFTDLPASGGAPFSISYIGPGFFYFNDTWRSGYTNNGNVIGSWIGRGGQGVQAWSTYHFSPRDYVQLSFRHQKVSPEFISEGGTVSDVSARSEYWIAPNLSIGASLQYEKWTFPVLAPASQKPFVGSVQVTFWPSHHDRQIGTPPSDKTDNMHFKDPR